MSRSTAHRILAAALALPLVLLLSAGCNSSVDVRWPGGRVDVDAGRRGARVNVQTPLAGVRVNAGRGGTAVDVRVPRGRVGVNVPRPRPPPRPRPGPLPPGWRAPPRRLAGPVKVIPPPPPFPVVYAPSHQVAPEPPAKQGAAHEVVVEERVVEDSVPAAAGDLTDLGDLPDYGDFMP